jgi:integrase
MAVPALLVEALEQLCSGKPSRVLIFGDGFIHQRRQDQRKDWFVYAKKSSGGLAELTIHDLRRTAARLSIASGANLKAVRWMLAS